MKEVERKEEDKGYDAPTGENSQLVDANLVSPLPHALGGSTEENFVPSTPARGKNLDGTPRKKTFGENLFDWSVYGGIGWIANEFLSGIIFDSAAYKNQPFRGVYEKSVNGLHKMFGKAAEAHPEKWIKAIRRPFDIFIMTIGGNLLVVPMKIAEDYKGDLVRSADRMAGRKDDDPEIQQAHAEMDAAPKQTWGTLAQSRLGTLAGAIGIDYAFGAEDSWLTKITKDVGKQKWLSLNNVNTSVFRKIAKFAEKTFNYDVGVTERINAAEKVSPFTIIDKKMTDNLADSHELKKFETEGKIASFGKSFGFIFLLSGVLAGIFYINSRIFAFNRDQKEHKREDAPHHAGHAGVQHDVEPAQAPARIEQLERSDEIPKVKINTVQSHERLAQAPHEAVGING